MIAALPVGRGVSNLYDCSFWNRAHTQFFLLSFLRSENMTRSTFAKSLSGTLRLDRETRLNREDVLSELPPPPAGLSSTAASAWQRLGGLAIEAQTITRFDLELLDFAARTAASCRGLEAQLAADGILLESPRGSTKVHSGVAALDRSRSLLLRLLGSLGLTPKSRERLPMTPSVKRKNKFACLDD